MKILLVNSVCGYKSTGRICAQIANDYMIKGHEVIIAYGRGNAPENLKKHSYKITTEFETRLNALTARIFDNEGLNAKWSTRRFIKWAERFNPDVLWLHNLHGYYLNYEILFKWIKTRPNMKVKWTLHDCWAFTGHCTYFTMIRCNKWQSKCYECPKKKVYPACYFFDSSTKNFEKKKKSFTGVEQLTLIVPSNWLRRLVEASFLQEYDIEVKYNSVDTSVFKPVESDFRRKYGLEDKIIILGVASDWSYQKGLNEFYELSQCLDNNYVIVLVGLDKKQKRKAPSEIICIDKTNDVNLLAEIYSAADCYVNPSKEETFGLTTAEAICCGTYPIVYKDTACEEVVNMYNYGEAVSIGSENICKAIASLKD